MDQRLRYKPSPENQQIHYIGAVEEFDIYISGNRDNYVVRWSDGSSAKFPTRFGKPDADKVKAAPKLAARPDVSQRIAAMIDLFG